MPEFAEFVASEAVIALLTAPALGRNIGERVHQRAPFRFGAAFLLWGPRQLLSD